MSTGPPPRPDLPSSGRNPLAPPTSPFAPGRPVALGDAGLEREKGWRGWAGSDRSKGVGVHGVTLSLVCESIYRALPTVRTFQTPDHHHFFFVATGVSWADPWTSPFFFSAEQAGTCRWMLLQLWFLIDCRLTSDPQWFVTFARNFSLGTGISSKLKAPAKTWGIGFSPQFHNCQTSFDLFATENS